MTPNDRHPAIDLTLDEVRAVTAFALACAESVLPIAERDCPGDPRPRTVLDRTRAFVTGGPRTQAIRVTALAAHRAAREARDRGMDAAAEAALAAGHTGGAAYLHPLATATQGGHILLSAAHAARARELDTGDPTAAADTLATAQRLAGPVVRAVLRRYPPAPARGRGRVGELWRTLDSALRQTE
ncbi:putative immunity protein [Nocardia farcinica]|uniref:putative immunity protein n=1 Tax=Nocardia farcinica TaxID=37329 RepID=UPI0018951C97|nr:exonuclease SbcC [Nocardia farcinica]MBF6290566.1 exonuclease SbcC [Nocardia farcinica]MBF6377739.1 exonuclease SbcC [Nocardia farcinica]